jgi:hypothetical protein
MKDEQQDGLIRCPHRFAQVTPADKRRDFRQRAGLSHSMAMKTSGS